ncbi:MAG TPA: hypothetical protein VKY19_25855 [Ktedonosporobacter sp.]|jgi:hypothetical protein|nr:hypothetical protein [Ktedonosporobacter sp.]
MTYIRRNSAQEPEEACKKAQQIMAICQELSITLDPIDWQHSGMRAAVAVNKIEIADLANLSRQDSDSILRLVQSKLFEYAARETLGAQPAPKALIWSPVDVIRPQPFLSLWIMTMETDERIAIAEYLRNSQRTYEPYALNIHDEQQLEMLFGPLQTGEYHLGSIITLKEREQTRTGEIIYILGPGKTLPGRKHLSRGYHIIAGKSDANNAASRYLVDCHDGFPHIVHQWQVIS